MADFASHKEKGVFSLPGKEHLYRKVSAYSVELQLALVEEEFALYLSGRWRFFLRKSLTASS
jgi:hypothetical protein